MKKKKLLLPLAVMTLSCGLAAGILTGCGGHKHNFTEWGYDDSGHWQICVEDGEKSEKKNHVFGSDGKCECGAEKPKYGTASGQVKLWKMGEFVTDYTGVTLDTGEDDGTEIDFDAATGKFEITNAHVGKSYTLTISKTGYVSYSTTLEVVENENSVIGESTGCVLNYEVFNSFLTEWDHASHSYAHANDTESYIDFSTGGTFNPVTQDSYTEVAATLHVDWNNSTNDEHTQGIALIFANGKHAVVRYHNGKGNGNIQFCDNAWAYGKDASVFKDSGLLNEYGEYAVHQLSDEERAAITDGENPGLDLTVSLKGAKLYVYFNEEFVTAYKLPEDVQGQSAKIGYFAWNPKQNTKFYFDISQDIPSYPSTVELKTNVPDGATDVNIALDKTAYSLGDDVTLNVTLPAEKYIVSALTLNGESVLNRLQNGKLTFVAMQEENELVVTVDEIKYADVDVAVKGKKYDVKNGSSIVNDTAVTLKGQGGLEDVTFKVANGKIAKTHVVQGTYTAQVEGYKPVEVVVGENGIANEIVFEYDGFTMLPPKYFDASSHDFSQINEGVIKVNTGTKTGSSMDVLTKDSYEGDLAVTIKVNGASGGVIQGIVLQFEDGTFAIFNVQMGEKHLQFKPDQWGMISVWGQKRPGGGDNWIEFRNVITDADKGKFDDKGIDLTLVKKDGTLYAFLGGRYIGRQELPEARKNDRVQVGFFAQDTKLNASWNFTITQTAPSLASTFELTKNVPEDATSVDVALDKTACTLGDTVTLTVTLPEEGYIVSVLTLNGESVLDRLSDGTLAFTAMQSQNAVVVTVMAVTYADVTDVSVTGKKLGVSGNSLEGETITLKGQGGLKDVTFTVTDGKITQTHVIQGTYTAQAAGYNSVENVVVGANGIESEIVFEYNTFNHTHTPWGDFDYTKQNDEKAQVGFTNDCCTIFTNDTYDDVMFSIYLNRTVITQGDQGISVRFQNDGKAATVRLEGTAKVHFIDADLWEGVKKADGSGWQNLIHFNNNNEGSADADSVALNNALNEGTCKLTVVRRGATLYVYLTYGGKVRCIGSRTFDAKYANAKAQVGIYSSNVNRGNKAIQVELTTDLSATIDAATAENGAVTVSAGTHKAGDKVTLTLTPDSGYIVKSLTVGGMDVTGSIVFDRDTNSLVGTYEFVTAANVGVLATFEQATRGGIEANIGGSGYGETTPIDLNGKKVTLTGVMEKYSLTVTDGKITQTGILAGVYTLSAEGYVLQKITIAADGTYSTAITLVYNIFTAESASADLSKLTEGKVTATGNGGLSLVTKESYTDVTAEAVFDLVGDYATTQRRYSVGLAFGDGKVFRVDLDLHEGNRHIVQEPIWDTMMGFNWGVAKEYTPEEVNAFTNVKFKLVRKGDKVTVYVNDQEIKTYTLPENYATETAQVKFIFDSNGTDGTKGFTFDITVSE